MFEKKDKKEGSQNHILHLKTKMTFGDEIIRICALAFDLKGFKNQ
jgi:hypothetical protein